jgi:hypothetical protein
MTGFEKYTHKDSLRLKERPYYRRRGVDALRTFVNNSMANYESNANRIRGARFAKSNELNCDFAIRNKREQMLSEAYMTERDPVKLAGLHGRLRMKLTRSDGALSSEMPYVSKTKFKAPKQASTSSGGSTQAPMSAVRFAPENDPQSVAPVATEDKGKHLKPDVADGAGFSIKRRQQTKTRNSADNKISNDDTTTVNNRDASNTWKLGKATDEQFVANPKTSKAEDKKVTSI